MATLCRYCAKRIQPCDCGAGGKRHWYDDRNSRWCIEPAIRLHEPASREADR